MLRNWVSAIAVLALLAHGLHPQDFADPLQQEVDVSPAGIERRKALLRTERSAGFPDWRELDVDANGVVSESALAQQMQVPEMATQMADGQAQALPMVPGFNPMEDAINSIMSDLMPYKEELAKLNETALNKSDPEKMKQEAAARKQKEQLLREAHCWKECEACHFKDAQPIEECFSTLEEAKLACADAIGLCSGISAQSNVCNGTWTLNVGSADTVEVAEATLSLKTLTVDRECLKNVQNANASKYVIHLNNKSWVEAEKLCAEEGLQLATPHSREDVKALTAAMELKGAAKAHIGLRRDVQFGKGPWTDPSAFYWVTGEKLETDWPGWGGYGLASLSTNLLEGLPVKQPHLEAFLEGCCYLGYFQTLEEDGTKGAGDTTCDHFRIPFACQPIEERQMVDVTTTTSTAAPWFYGLALRGSGSCPQDMKVSPVPLSQCQEAAMKAQLPPGAKRGRTTLQAGYDVGSKDASQPWLGAPPGCSLHSGSDWAPVFNLGQGVNNGEYTPLCMQPQPNESTYLAKGIEVVETAFLYDRSGKYFYFPAEDWEEKTGRDLSPHGSTQSVSQYRHNFPVWSGIVRVWRNVLGVHGRREFNAMAEQWQRGDVIEVGVMCPAGFSLVPYDLDGPDQMHFDTDTLGGCAQKCQEVVKCSSFEFSHSESSCNTFSNSMENFKAFLSRPNEWISCARSDLLRGESTAALDAAQPSAARSEEAYAWKKALGLCAFADGSEITSGFSLGNLSLKECHESCRSQLSCTAYQMEGSVGICYLHTSIYAAHGSGKTDATCYIKPVLMSCGTYNSEDCAESYAIAEQRGSTTEFCQKCMSSDAISLLRDRCQLCCEKCSMSIETPTTVGVNASREIDCPPNSFNLDGDAANGCEVGCPKVPGANLIAHG